MSAGRSKTTWTGLLASQPGSPESPDLLSIDVDGNDYHIWQATTRIRPKLVLIEYNPTMANCLDFVKPADARCNQGNSPAALVRLGKEKDYELIAATRLNLLFVDRRYYSLFRIPDNSLEAMSRRSARSSVLRLRRNGIRAWRGGSAMASSVAFKGRCPGASALSARYPPTCNRLQQAAVNLWRWFRDPSSQSALSEPNHIAEERRRTETLQGK